MEVQLADLSLANVEEEVCWSESSGSDGGDLLGNYFVGLFLMTSVVNFQL